MNTTPWPTWASALILTLGAAGISAAADATDQARAAADCREEGQAEGLDGAALDAFVADCVRALQQVEIRNLER
jgi:hypothetical protein